MCPRHWTQHVPLSTDCDAGVCSGGTEQGSVSRYLLEEAAVTSGKGCAEEASLACGRTGWRRTQPALLVREMKYLLYQLLLSSKSSAENSSPATQRMQNTKQEEVNKTWPVPFLSLFITFSCVINCVSRSGSRWI